MNAREAAYNALLRHENNASYSNIELDATIKKYGLEGVERSFCTALFYGVIERAITLDYYISLLSDRDDIDTNVRVILRMGLYQIIYMDKVPDSAAVNESVGLARRFWARKNSEGFINAILRSYLREKDKLSLPNKKKDPIKHISVKYSMPEWLCAMFCENYGADTAEKIFDEFNKVPTLTLRVNTLKTTRESLMERLWAAGIKATPTKNAPNGLLLAGGTPYSALEAFEGEFFVQNEASQICVEVLGAKAGETILDACACPGGKSFGISINMKNEGAVNSCDLHKNKLSLIERGAKNLGISIIETMERNAAKEDTRGVKYDRILCDVPCSGLGVIAQKPDIKRKNPDDIERLPTVQAAILRESAKHLKNGGVLVYSTCTLNPRENSDVVDAFLAENKDFSLVPFEVGGIKSDGKAELFPHIHKTNGFFIAKMKKA
ncbi:MAG: 16S rRNA (cytosine(967)-C(5))-methyltransferase RsmB [Clostridia bacterium]|nr:16S rRNA (cytosine(967)-C(5))-methyltransferase RsmB [Clostridia bacterium]